MPNFCARIVDTAGRFPDGVAIERIGADAVDTVTYRGLVADAAAVAAWLRRAGVVRGDRLAIFAGNDARWISTYLGILWIGAVAVPLDTAYNAPQVATIVTSSGARWLFVSHQRLDVAREAAAILRDGARAAGTPLTDVGVAGADRLPGGVRIALLSGHADEAAGADVLSVDDATAQEPPLPILDIEAVEANEAAAILYTSGTTADPKGVVLTHANLDAERAAVFAVLDVSERDTVLGVLPLFHALAQTTNFLLPLSAGARVIFLETVSATALLGALQTRGVTIFVCVPQFFYLIHERVLAEVARGGSLARRVFRVLLAVNAQLRNRAGWNPGKRWFAKVHRQLGAHMRLLVTGGSKFDPAIGRDLHALGFTLLNGYGLTETCGAATLVRPRDRYTTSVGQPLPGVDVRIADKSATDAFDDGEILIRGAIVMREYFNRPDATRDAIHDGWLYTGDLGRVDPQGRVFITGRKKEIIVLASGKNLYPEEIEAHYRQSPLIMELCVLGLARPGEPAAERLHAVIVPDEQALRARGIVNIGDIIRFEIETRSASLPAHKRVLSYDIVPVSEGALPRTSTGKLRRHEIERRVRERERTAAAPETREVSEDDRGWLADPAHAAAMAAVATHVARPGRAAPRPDANLELDLGLDSMERVELLSAMERRAGTRVSPEVRATIFSVRQLVDAVASGERVADRGTDASADAADAERAAGWPALLADTPDPALVAQLRRSSVVVAALFFAVLRASALAARVLWRFRSSGQEHLPRAGAFLLCPNHQSYLDGFALASALPFRVLRHVFFVGATEYFETPLTAWMARLVNIVPVDPDANLITAMKAGAAGLRLGRVLILFPEGERSIDGEVKRFRKGAAILSSELHVPIVPVRVDGFFPVWPRGAGFSWRALARFRGLSPSITFGAPLELEPGEYGEGADRLRNAVVALRAPGGR